MNKTIIFLGQNININNYDLTNSYLIGVDKGAYILAKNNIVMDLSVGDFDSIDNESKELVYKYSKRVKELNPIKDDTDTNSAIREAIKISSDITILGGIQGKRVEHLIANIFLLKEFPNVKMIDDNTEIFIINKDCKIKKDEYKFISIFPLEESILSLNGFKYNLDNYKMKSYDYLGVSNEVSDDFGKITLFKGQLLIIKSKQD
ncbi:MAG: thiamine diphosphokinase [Acholeplasmatales bacterium]|nr:thiamine diphosphokinase [Acholeplasmatales bacterium]